MIEIPASSAVPVAALLFIAACGVSKGRESPSPSRTQPTPVSWSRDRSRDESRPKVDPPTRPSHPTGKLLVAKGHAPPSGSGSVRRYLVEVEQGLPVGRNSVARFVREVLYDHRSWGSSGALAVQWVDSPPVSFRVTLASPGLTDRLCAPLVTAGIYSCHQDGRAVLNFWRWTKGAPSYKGALVSYRRYMVNHEVGHALGYSSHGSCPAPGARAPVMMQQTKGTEGCKPHPWPLPAERASIL